MSKRASKSVESGPSAKRPSIEPSGVSNVPVRFAALPQGNILPFDNTKAIRTDFNVDEYISSEANVLITDTMKRIYRKLRKNDSPFKVLLCGASGVGKTTTLLFVGHMARKSGCLVFPIQARKFVDQVTPLSEIVRSFLSDWIDAVGEEFLKQIPCKWAKFSNLFALVNDGLDDLNKVIQCFQTLVGELKSLKVVPVVFLIDQCNAFYSRHTLQIFSGGKRTVVEPGSGQNPIASLFVQWNTFDLKSGCILYAFSSSFNSMPTARDGNSDLFETLQPMDRSEFKKLVELSVKKSHVPHELLQGQTFKELFALCSGIPRELVAFTRTWKRCRKPIFELVKIAHLKNRREFYKYQIKRLFDREKMGEELFKASVSFASCVFVGRPMDDVPPTWRHAGLITSGKSGVYQLLCPAAADALLTSIDHDVMREAVSIFTSDPNMRWRALELGVVYVFRQAIVSGDPVVLECTKGDGESSAKLSLKVNNIVRCESGPPASSLPRGTMFVCPVGTPLINCFIHGMDGQKVALQVSESTYADHKSKYLDYEKIKEDYKNAVIDGNALEIQYVYLTTSTHKMKKIGKHFKEQVLLISNINNGAANFFKGLI